MALVCFETLTKPPSITGEVSLWSTHCGNQISLLLQYIRLAIMSGLSSLSSYAGAIYSSSCCQRAPRPSMTASIKPRTLREQPLRPTLLAVMCGCPVVASFSLPRSCHVGCLYPSHARISAPACLCPIRPRGDPKAGNEPWEQNVKTACTAVEIGGGAPYVITLDA